jgi:hypothetical protein
MEDKKMEEKEGRKQLLEIIQQLISNPEKPRWDFVNGVLSSEMFAGGESLWFYWGNLLIVPADAGEGTKAGQLKKLGRMSVWKIASGEERMLLIPKRGE